MVEEARREQTSFAVTNITSDQVALFVREKSIDKTVEDALAKDRRAKGRHRRLSIARRATSTTSRCRSSTISSACVKT